MGLVPHPSRRAVRFAVLAALMALSGFALLTISGSHSGDAAFPGGNGRIAYAYGDGYAYSGGAIWVADSDGGSQQRLTNGGSDATPSYSPDGKRIAFGRENGVAVMAADGSGAIQLATGHNSVSSQVKWQQNYDVPGSGKTVPVVRIQSYVQEWRLFDHPSFSPNGSQLAVGESRGRRTQSSICAVQVLGDQQCIFNSPDAYFDFDTECADCGAQIVTIDSATGARSLELTPLISGRDDSEPTYAPDGKLAFVRWVPGGSSIFVIDSPGSAPRRVTRGPGNRAPDFSPDSSQIVFVHGGSDVGLVGVGGGAVTLLPVPAPAAVYGGYVGAPAFSPDGSRVVFRRGSYGPAAQSETGLYTMGLDGSGFAQVVDSGSDPTWEPLSPPPPPPARARAKAKKGKVKLNRKGRATIGTVVCGSTPCKLKILSAKMKIGKHRCAAKARLAKRLAPEKVTKVRVKVAGKCLAALKKAGKGRLVTRVRVTDALGKKTLTLKSTLVPPPSG
jgi:Tol biopolymer transport system component